MRIRAMVCDRPITAPGVLCKKKSVLSHVTSFFCCHKTNDTTDLISKSYETVKQ